MDFNGLCLVSGSKVNHFEFAPAAAGNISHHYISPAVCKDKCVMLPGMPA